MIDFLVGTSLATMRVDIEVFNRRPACFLIAQRSETV